MSPEIIAGVAGAAGYVSGLAVEQLAVRHAAKNQANLTEALGLAMDQDDERKVSLTQKAARTLLAPLALTAGAAVALETYANIPGQIIQTTPAVLEIVVDHSGATALDFDNKQPVTTVIDQLANRLDNKKVNSEAPIAGNDKVKIVKVSEVKNDEPFGGAPITQAVTFALNKTGFAAATPDAKTGKKRTTGVVLITNGNNVVGAPALIKRAKQQNTPINVVNVEQASLANQATNTQLEQLAKQTHGKYWSANETNVDKITKDVVTQLNPNKTQRAPLPNRNLLRGLGIVGLVAVAGQYITRKNKTTGRGAKGE